MQFDVDLHTSPITGEVESGAWSDEAMADAFEQFAKEGS